MAANPKPETISIVRTATYTIVSGKWIFRALKVEVKK
jgi:hypothetical protein